MRILRTLIILTMATIFSASWAQAQNPTYGEVTHYLDGYTADLVSELGAGFVRLDFDWYRIETSKGNFNWGSQQDAVSNAGARGQQIFASLAYTPGWANGNQGNNVMPANIQDWRDFVQAAVLQFPEIRYWGVWNEPDSTHFLSDPNRYYELAWHARDVIKSIDPSLLVLGPEVSAGGIVSGWFRNVMQGWGNSIFDIVTVHYYNDGSSETKWVDQFMDSRVAPYRYNKEVWMTETGRNFCTYGEVGQSNHYQGVLERFEPRRSWWTKIFPYHLYDGQSCTDAIVGPGNYKRLAFQTYRNWIAAHP